MSLSERMSPAHGVLKTNALTPHEAGAMLPKVEGSPMDEVQGINREHGADDPEGAKAVTAPATVSEERIPK